MGDEIKIALALSAGALYLYLGIRKGEAPDWAFDLLAIIGVLIIGGALYKLFSPRGGRGDKRSSGSTRRPVVQWGPRGRGGSEFSKAGERMTTTLAPSVERAPPPTGAALASGPQGFEPDILAEWTSTLAPGQTSWDSTTLSPRETEVSGFAFGGR